jgi:hypothetical protein
MCSRELFEPLKHAGCRAGSDLQSIRARTAVNWREPCFLKVEAELISGIVLVPGYRHYCILIRGPLDFAAAPRAYLSYGVCLPYLRSEAFL